MTTQYTKLFDRVVKSKRVSYLLTESRVDTGEGVFTRFGVAIEMEGGEHAVAPDLYGDRPRAEAFVGALAEGQVTPVTLLDIAADRLYAEEFN